MVDWKAEGAKERLLAATFAACGLKVDMKAVAHYFGQDATYNAVEGQFRKIKQSAQVLIDEAGDYGGPSAMTKTPAPKPRKNAKATADAGDLNKVKSGRVAKSPAKGKKASKKASADSDEMDADGGEVQEQESDDS